MSQPQPRKPPPPLAQALVLCREVFEDRFNHEVILVGPLTHLPAAGPFPQPVTLAIFTHLTDGHGRYELDLEVRDADDNSIWRWHVPDPLVLENPFRSHHFTVRNIRPQVPRPGRYHVVLLANGDEVARHALQVGAPPDR